MGYEDPRAALWTSLHPILSARGMLYQSHAGNQAERSRFTSVRHARLSSHEVCAGLHDGGGLAAVAPRHRRAGGRVCGGRGGGRRSGIAYRPRGPVRARRSPGARARQEAGPACAPVPLSCSLVAREPPRSCASRLHRHARVVLNAAARHAKFVLSDAPWCRAQFMPGCRGRKAVRRKSARPC